MVKIMYETTNTATTMDMRMAEYRFFNKKQMFDFFIMDQHQFSKCMDLHADYAAPLVEIDPLLDYTEKQEILRNAEIEAGRNLAKQICYCNTLAKKYGLGFLVDFVDLNNDETVIDFVEGFWCACMDFQDYAQMPHVVALKQIYKSLFGEQ